MTYDRLPNGLLLHFFHIIFGVVAEVVTTSAAHWGTPISGKTTCSCTLAKLASVSFIALLLFFFGIAALRHGHLVK